MDDVRLILMKEWDPLSVGDNPNLSNGYDSYIPQIIRLLQRRPTTMEIIRKLKEIEAAKFGLDLPADARTRAAISLSKL